MAGFHCATCGRFHEQVPMSFGAPAPAPWFSIPEVERGDRVVLSSDQCILDGRHFFLLGRLELVVRDGTEPFTWLVWVSLSRADFERASELWSVEGRENEPPYSGWLQTELPYEPSTLNLEVCLHTRPVGERPYVELKPADHPLAVEQREGITMERVRAIAELVPHE